MLRDLDAGAVASADSKTSRCQGPMAKRQHDQHVRARYRRSSKATQIFGVTGAPFAPVIATLSVAIVHGTALRFRVSVAGRLRVFIELDAARPSSGAEAECREGTAGMIPLTGES